MTLSNVRERRTVPQANLLAAPSTSFTARAAPSLNDRQERAVTYMREYGRITNHDFQAMCPDVSAETLRSDLSALVERGMLLRVGEKRGTYYILK